MLRRLASALSATGIAITVAALSALPASAAPDSAQPRSYIVQLESPPVGEYHGGTAGIPGTSPRATGRAKVDARSSAAARYRSYLAGRQSRVLDRVGGPRPTVKYSYRNAFAGFAATLTAEQAKDLADAPEVAGVWKTTNDEVSSADDDLGGSDPVHPALGGDGAAWLRLTAPSLLDNAVTGVPGAGLWNRIGGGPLAANGPGDGLVIGVLDTGISPRNPSFASSPGTDDAYLGAPFGPRPTRFTGTCDAGDDSTFPGCTDKIVAARYYVNGLGAQTVYSSEIPLSPRDNDGHGSHTAGTAAGNYGVQPWSGGARISGIAPRARVAAYKVCWQAPTSQGVRGQCNDADIVAAIDQAVADGVDALNHSIGASLAARSPKQLAFLGAYKAGVFVAASAGNSGPGSSTITATPSPWTTIVASSTLNRAFQGKLTLSGTSALTVTGAAIAGSFSAAPIVDAAAPTAANPGGNAGLCMPGTLDRAAVAGKVVLCARGSNVLIEKSSVVKAAGGVGTVIGNTAGTADTTLNELHASPTVHVDRAAHAQIKAALAAGPHQASLTPRTAAAVPADGTTPRIAGSSSRGPVSGVEDLPVPNVSAPGVDVLAAVSGNRSFALYSGTSMATPHVAGAALLLRQRHPQWRPEQIQSALATSANPAVKLETGDARASALDVGSGQIDPNRADDPGLVVVPSIASLDAYLDAPAARAGALNLPAIAAWNMAGRTQTVRTFTSVDAASHGWRISTIAPPGTVVTTSPAAGETVTVAPGASTDVAVTVTATSDDNFNVPRTGGELRLTDEDGRTVRLPITVRPTALRAPSTALIRSEGSTGSRGLRVTSGSTGDFSATVAGFTGSTLSNRSFTTISDQAWVPLEVPAGTQGLLAARLQNASQASADVDLELWTANANGTAGTKVAASLNTGSNEFLQLRVPNGGRYLVKVFPYDLSGGRTTVDLRTWNTSTPTGNATLSVRGVPTDPVTAGDPIGLCAVAQDIGADQYFGLVTYHSSSDGSGPALGATIVDVAGGAPQSPCDGAPDTTIVSGPASPSPSGSATFVFGSDQEDVTYECRLDGATFAACPSPHRLSALGDGSHTLDVRAVNRQFADPSPATHTWTVDTFVPETVIASAPGAWTNDAGAAFVFSSPGGRAGVTFECRLDDAADYTACVSPYVPSSLADGPHRLRVRAVAFGGSDASPAEHDWNLDRTAPPAPTITGAPAVNITDRTATLTWTGEPDGGYSCRLGTGAWAPCVSPTDYRDLPLGPQSFAVRQTDVAGNVGPAAQVDWTIVAPQPPGQLTPPGVLDPPTTTVDPPTTTVDPPVAVVLDPKLALTATKASVRVPATIRIRGRTITVGCRVNRGTLTRCTVVARLNGRVVGRGSARFTGVRSGEVTVRLTTNGIAAIRRLGRARLAFRATVTAGGKRLTATRSAEVRRRTTNRTGAVRALNRRVKIVVGYR